MMKISTVRSAATFAQEMGMIVGISAAFVALFMGIMTFRGGHINRAMGLRTAVVVATSATAFAICAIASKILNQKGKKS